MADPLVPKKDELEPADPTWSGLPKPMDVNSMLAQVKNDLGDRLSYLYFVYRVASFDTHGNSMAVLFEQAFGKSCNFSALNLKFGFDLIANQYLVILQELAEEGEVQQFTQADTTSRHDFSQALSRCPLLALDSTGRRNTLKTAYRQQECCRWSAGLGSTTATPRRL